MNNINFYEVFESKHSKFMGAYSTKFDSEINIGCSSLNMAKINARHCGGEVFSVDFEGGREKVWPK